MNTLLKIVPAAALALSLTAPAANAQSRDQWMTTADGCTYSRVHAPGYAPSWVLVGNPTHLKRPYGGTRCKNML
ncbi:hypothetical protein KO498_06575 [Lentibacter algarum]|uniref:hypothetical protein n=1 Tax=Lentibacter algarum TaxID=576131 RepID=UPI001C066EFD|nr:hypothetical protein [Lentibacter algarum]MBU2981477.1 hypothetical protein [Lentibacter algarum]